MGCVSGGFCEAYALIGPSRPNPASPTVAENEAVHNLHGKPGGCDAGTMWRRSFHGAKSANFDGV